MPKNLGQLGRLELAIQAVRNGQITSIQKAAQLYDIPRSTLRDRLNGGQEQASVNRTKRKLTITEEDTILQWILTMDNRGAPLRPSSVRDMANLLLLNRDASKPPPTVGTNWVYHFIRRHNTLKTRFSRKYDYRRALYEDSSKI